MSTATPPLPKELQLEITAACNLACRMCLVRYRPKVGKKTGAMCFHVFRSIVDDLPELEKLTLQGLGEPMLAPDLERMVEHAARRGVSCGLNTNGTLLTRERADRLIEVGLDWLHVSLDGATADTYEFVRDGSDFERVRENVAGLVAAKRDHGTDRPRLSLVFVAMRRNIDELPDVVRLAHEWEVERLFVQNLSHTFSDTDPSGSYAAIRRFAGEQALFLEPERAEAVFGRAREVADELGVDLRLPRLEEPQRPPREPGTPGCHWPFEAAYVTHKGLVQPCCMVMGDDRATLGDASAEGFAAVWRGNRYAEFRKALTTDDPPEVCAGCSLYHGLF